MKTKEEFLAGQKAFGKRIVRRAYILVPFLLLMISIRQWHWLPRGTFSWMPLWGGILMFGFAPIVIIHLLIGGSSMRGDARRCGYICDNCGKALGGADSKMKSSIEANKCPFCGLPLYLA
jgi:hypothetical protein